jgi:hypothetical protein
MADRLAEPRAGGQPLRDLGMIIALLEVCAEQRGQYGGLEAVVTRGDLAERTGLSIDRVDGCNRALEQANVLEIKRRRTGNGGRNLPSIYSVIEPDGQGRTTGAPGPHDRSARTAPQEQRSQDATTPAPRTRPSNLDSRFIFST